MTMPPPFPVEPGRTSPVCGEPWPKLTIHICPPQPFEDNEALCSLLWDAINDLDIPLGGINIANQVATIIARPLSRQLLLLRTDLTNALEAG